jgi:hypothetical protein
MNSMSTPDLPDLTSAPLTVPLTGRIAGPLDGSGHTR